ncbi:MAG TPA: glycoside hydrolase family 15 protein [Candidatus Sulfotelmatobacter sp.]|nr:glycoside hydrolase family 15 protein [Candidatus Sulfotelmatobacter sp.]
MPKDGQTSRLLPNQAPHNAAESVCVPWPQIEDYGIIGNCRSAALVSRQGSIDWLCWPRFDKPAIFAALLDRDCGGHWRICPVGSATVERHYIPDSNVLETRFTNQSGFAILTDLMPSSSRASRKRILLPDQEILRKISCDTGELELEVEFKPMADYGKSKVKIRDYGKLGLRFVVGNAVYWLRSSVALTITDGTAYARVSMHAGESLRFSFSYSDQAPSVLPPLDASLDDRIDQSVKAWQNWGRHAAYGGEYRDTVVRSALALKLLSYAPSGAIIAAATTSLPELPGGDLNWDYRYCWLRDASFTIRALLELDYWDEAEDFLDWLLRATSQTQPKLRILYSLYGDKAPVERELEHLSGYRDSRPVRIGNAARDQLQLDVYGEVVDAAAQFAFHGGHLDRDMQRALIGFGDYVAQNWDQPDEGIWEPRCGRQNHTHSRLLCWTAMDRLIRLCERDVLRGAPVENYKRISNLIRRQIEERAWNEQMQSYVSVLDSDQLDSSLLLLSWYGFEDAKSARMRTTYRAIRQHLATPEGLLFRYQRQKPEGTFAICSFWEAEYLAMGGGTLEEAQQLFAQLMKYKNDLGLYGEEIDANTGSALGNFPQAFTHVGLIGAALSIDQREKGERQLAHRPPAAAEHPSSEVRS